MSIRVAIAGVGNCASSLVQGVTYYKDTKDEDKIPGLMHLEVRRAFNGMDYALYSEFESRETLTAYASHPLHLEAKSHFHHLLNTRVAADYEC